MSILPVAWAPSLGAADGAQGGDVLDHADLVVHRHDRGQDGVGADRSLEDFQIHQAVVHHVQVGDLEAFALQLTHGVEHGLVLGLDGDQVLALALVELGGALDGQVVGLGGTRGPDHLTRVGTDQGGDMLAGNLDGLLGSPAIGMAAGGGVAELFVQVGQHRLNHPGIDGGRRGVVQIDWLGNRLHARAPVRTGSVVLSFAGSVPVLIQRKNSRKISHLSDSSRAGKPVTTSQVGHPPHRLFDLS